ncbi:Cullin-4B [Ephemerocybe angulata]|uniref:Cullin-4B n=1 Tax=Ephemerocybe angulata TaxID=980116 RepID=A0A8H6I4N6_9AGAR|nr:Cullin-4B [Tulosesus angulatus]
MEVSMLLTLPTASNGVQFLSQTPSAHRIDGSASPRRKIARLETDSDTSTRSKSTVLKGPITIRVQSDDNAFKAPARGVATKQELLRACVHEIMDETQEDLRPLKRATYEKVYRTCRSVILDDDGGAHLYDNVFHREVRDALRRIAATLIATKEEAVAWIATLVKYCKWFEKRIALLESLLTYLDQVYVVNHSSTRVSLHDEAYHLFAQGIFGNAQVAELLRSCVGTWLEWERETHSIASNRAVIPELVEYLTIHKQFSAFEQYYIDTTREYYQRESDQTPQDDAFEYFKRVQARIAEEDERARAVLPVGSWGVVRQVTETSLLDGKVEWLSNSLLPELMEARDTTTLGEMYKLFSRVDGLKPLQEAFKFYIQKVVQGIVTDVQRDEDMVQRLLDFKAQVVNVISNSFVKSTTANEGSSTDVTQPDPTFISVMNNAFTFGFRSRRNKPAEMIAKYLHLELRKGQRTLTNAEYQAKLNAALEMYRYSEDKDVFRTFYHRMLARRLLMSTSASDDSEAAMLKKLKEQYDPEFGMGEDMFKDLNVSKDMMKAYHASKAENERAQRLNVFVLQRSAWPFTVPLTLPTLPSEMQKDLEQYEAFYKLQHSGRSLKFDHALGSAVLKGRFSNGVRDLTVSLYQAIVLLLFNNQEEIAFAEIKARTQMEDGELRRTLQSLACGKKKVLKKTPPGRDVDDDDVFRYNADFWDERARVHINSIQAKVTTEETQKTNEAIEGDRKHYLDAAIVRIMKGKKEMTFEQLKVATIDAVKNHFAPSVNSIKERIDVLVETEYLKRSDEDWHLFQYVA